MTDNIFVKLNHIERKTDKLLFIRIHSDQSGSLLKDDDSLTGEEVFQFATIQDLEAQLDKIIRQINNVNQQMQ